jgi:hypothetical protein
MRFPNFSAEASLVRSSGGYRATRAHRTASGLSPTARVVPALPPRLLDFNDYLAYGWLNEACYGVVYNNCLQDLGVHYWRYCQDRARHLCTEPPRLALE